ncbi:MAG: phosphotransferase, partial [Magnetovibrio sp.]|nr:phosphotransferase [Magnetovibrio sp.]
SERVDAITRFLTDHGWAGATRRTLADDASFRRYDRLRDGTREAVLMDAPPPQEDVRPFVRIARHLADLGFSAPEVLAEDVDQGFLLIEDLGDATYTRVLADAPDREHDLYALAIDVLIDLHGRAGAVPAGLPAYDMGRLLDEALLLTDWFVPAVTGREMDGAARESYLTAWQSALGPVAAAPPTLVLRDYHVDNLMWLPERPGPRACGVLDFQDAVAGPAAYDLMSLLEDARRDIAPALKRDMWARYTAAFPELADGAAAQAFAAQFHILGAQRHAKVIGIFTRLAHRDAKPAYLVHIPRVWRLLESSLSHPALAPVAAWMDAHVPPETRIQPPESTSAP